MSFSFIAPQKTTSICLLAPNSLPFLWRVRRPSLQDRGRWLWPCQACPLLWFSQNEVSYQKHRSRATTSGPRKSRFRFLLQKNMALWPRSSTKKRTAKKHVPGPRTLVAWCGRPLSWRSWNQVLARWLPLGLTTFFPKLFQNCSKIVSKLSQNCSKIVPKILRT